MKTTKTLSFALLLAPLFIVACDPNAAEQDFAAPSDSVEADILDKEAEAEQQDELRAAELTEKKAVDIKSLQATVKTCTQWTPWLDRDNSSGVGDFEDRALQRGVCKQPTAVECRTTAGAPLWVAGEDFLCSTDLARCVNSSQPDGRCDFDYKVRFLCPCDKPTKPSITYQAHVKNSGWLNWVSNGATAGTTGQSRRMEALRVKLVNAPAQMQVCYQTHLKNIGWTATKCDGQISGTTGQSRRMEAAKIWLQNAPSGCSVQYRAHVKGNGWLNWKSNGQIAGTTGQSRRMEAIQIKLVGC